MRIFFLQVGGTIDKDYPKGENHHGYNFEIGDAAAKRIIERAKVKHECRFQTIDRKDSLDMDDSDRMKIFDFVKDSTEKNIIITHGTDTMVKTAELLRTLRNKKIILTGSLLPEKFKDSDADFNIGVAVGAIQYISFGVYMAIEGELTKLRT